MGNSFLKSEKGIIQDLRSDIDIELIKEPNPKSMLKCHYHSKYELYYLYSGERLYFIQDTTYHIKKGSLVLIPPNVVHSTLNAKDCSYERFLVTFSKEDIEEFSQCFDDLNFYEAFEKGIYVVNFLPKEQLVIEAILHNMNENKDITKRKFLLTQILFYANNSKELKPETSEKYLSATQKSMTEVIAYINNNFSQDITLEDISSLVFMDSCYLSRIFKKTVGISFVDYLNNVRVLEAKKLLNSSDETIISIAEKVGFRSNTHFGRVFKKITGTPPLQYRKNKKREL